MKKTLALSLFLWLIAGIFFCFQFRKVFAEQELAKSHLLAEVLAAKNAPFLQSGLEPFISAKESFQWTGVRDAWIENEQAKAITPRQKISNPSGLIRIEKPLENGKAVLLYQPQPFPFVRLGLAWVLPILVGVSFLMLRRRSKPNPIALPNTTPWLAPFAKLMGKKFYISDPQGNILASAPQTTAKHLLDLFPNPEESQRILKTMEGLEEHAGIGAWSEENGEKRFLVIHG